MPERKQDSKESNVKPSQSQPSAIALPIDVEQLVSEVPKGAVSSVARPKIQLSVGSKPVLLKRRPTIGSYWLNTPLTEGAITVPMLFKVLKGLAETYQRTHQDAFFAQYPDLIIQYPGETDWMTLSNSVMRANYKEWASRAAHHIWHYHNAAAMLVGSLANILVMSRINGTEALKTIASAFRWSVVNSRTNLYKQWYLPASLEDYIFGNTKMAVGKSNHDSPFVAYPLWITDVYGNRGCHALPFTNLQRLTSEVNKDISFVKPIKPTVAPEAYARAQGLLDNMFYTQIVHGTTAVKDVNTTAHQWTEIPRPHMPDPENGTTITLGGDAVGTARLNADGVRKGVDPLIDSLWDNWNYWLDYMVNYFSEFMDPESDWVNICSKELKLIKKAMDVRDALNIVHSAKNTLDAAQLIPLMTMKRENKPNTATIIKWAPLYTLNDTTNGGTTTKGPLNYARYSLVKKSVGQMLKDSEIYPRLTPTVIGGEIDKINTYISGDVETPIVLNTIPGVGDWFNDGAGSGKDGANYAEILGPAATLFDLACANAIDPDASAIFSIGALSDDMTELVKQNSAIMVEEYPTSPFVKVQPLIDTSDPFQCGFNVLLSYDTVNPSEWEEFLKSSEYFPKGQGTGVVDLKYQVGSGTNKVFISNVAVVTTEKDASNKDITMVTPAHVAIGSYLAFKKHAQVFVGMGIFTHPVEALMSKEATHGEMKSGAQPVASGPGMITEFDTDGTNKTHMVFDGEQNNWKDLSGGPAAYIANSFFKMLAIATNDVPINAVPADNDCFAATLQVLFEQALSVQGNGKIDYHLFSPMYPPVNFARPEVPDIVAVSNSTQLQPDDSSEDWGTQATPTPQMGVPFFGFPGSASNGAGGQGYSPAVGYAKREFIVIPRDTIYWFLEAFRIVTGEYESNGSFIEDPAPCVRVLTATRRKQAAAVLSHVTTMFAGQEDMHPFWTIAALPKVEGDELPTMDLIPVVDLMVEPRRQNAVGAKSGYQAIAHMSVKYKSETQEAASAIGTSTTGGEKEASEDLKRNGGNNHGKEKFKSGYSNSSRKPGFRRSGEKGIRKDNNRDGRRDGNDRKTPVTDQDHEGVKPDFKANPNNHFEGSPMDPTSKEFDDKQRTKEKKPVNPLQVVVG